MVRSMTKRGMPKPFAILVAALMALYFVPFVASPAQAADVGGFEIEGNLIDDSQVDPPIDWFDLGPGSPGFGTGVDNVDNTGQDTTTFQGSSKEFDESGSGAWPSWQFGTGNATGKSDFGRWATYDFVDDNDHVWFYFAFDRGFGTGTAKYAFELNQVIQSPTTDANPVRSQGDIRLVIYDQGNGTVTLTADAQNPDVGVYVWDDPDVAGLDAGPVDSDQNGEWVKSPDQSGVFAGSSNTGEAPIAVPSWWTGGNVTNGTLSKDTFLEFGIDLTSFGAVLGCPSAGFTAVNARSITGTGGPGTLVDYLAAIPVTIPSSCASLVINKEDEEGDPLGGATFTISPNPLPVGTPGRPDGSSITIFDDSDANTTVEAGTNYDDPDATAGKITLAAVVPGVEYTITEVVPPAGYIGETGSKTVTPAPFGGASVTFVNTLGSVMFFKAYEGPNGEVPAGATFHVVRDSDGDADFGEESGANVITVQDNGTNDEDPTLGEIKLSDLLTGNYRIRETNAPTGWIADGDDVFFTIPGAGNTADVVLSSPTFNDPRATYPLQVKKLGVVPNQADTEVAGAVFVLWRDTNGTPGLQKASDTNAGSCTTGANGTCSVTNQPWGFDYFWEEISVPAPWNLPNVTIQGPVHLNADGSTNPAGATVFTDPKSKIVTQATNGNLPNATISDTATLSGVNNNATGTVTFDLYYTGQTEPTGNSCVPANLVTAGIPATAAVDGPGDYTTGPVSVSQAGFYAWVAHYSGDANGNRAISGACDDTGETSLVEGNQPGISTVAMSPDATLPSTELFDTAKVSPVTGNLDTTVANVDFRLYGPGDTDCSGTPVFVSLDRPVTVVADGPAFYATAESAHYNATLAGTYRWTAHFDGDANNADADSACNATNEDSTVDKATPSITTQAGSDKVLGLNGVSLQDSATLAGGTTNPAITGSIVFKLYYSATGPLGAGDCDAGTLVAGSESTVPVSGNGTYLSTPVNVTEAGWYNWTANYEPGGDPNNADIPAHGCGLDMETVKVSPAQPTLTTTAGDDQVIGIGGANLTDTAHLAGATSDATGTITYTLYGPFATDPTGDTDACVVGKVIDTVTNPIVDGNGNYVSPSVAVTQTGYYVWVASYSGDDNNLTATHPCGDASEVVRVGPRQPVITTDVPGPNELALGASGTVLTDQATLSEATAGATGSISFQLYGPFDAAPTDTSCVDGKKVGAAVNATSPVSGNGTYTSGTKTVFATGYYTWVATYSGDADNLSATHPCGQASETVLITKAPTSITTEVTDAEVVLAPTATLVDTATLSGATVNPPAGGTIAFSLYGPFATDPTDPEGDSTVCVVANLVETVGTTTSVSGPDTYTSEPVTVNEAGFYVWLAAYSGDADNLGSIHGCGDAKEVSMVTKTNPAISTAATNGTLPPGTISDSANLTGVTGNAGGSITFRLYGPSATPNCSGSPVFTSAPVAVSGPGNYGPVTATVNAGGSYYWIASYSGDANNNPVAGACGDAGETSVVRVLQGALNVTKAVSPVAGGGTVVEFGDTLTYTLTVNATGELTQHAVVVSDYVPGYDPARPSSGKTTYVNGSAVCIGAGTCTVTQPGADHKISWALGDMAPGTSRQVTFKVTIDDVAGDPGETVAVDILNAGAVRSTETPQKPSNQVITPVTKVFPVKAAKPPKVLPHTGAELPLGPLSAGAVALLGLGLLLLAAGSRRRSPGAHRA